MPCAHRHLLLLFGILSCIRIDESPAAQKLKDLKIPCGLTVNSHFCKCDSYCQIYGDCCGIENAHWKRDAASSQAAHSSNASCIQVTPSKFSLLISNCFLNPHVRYSARFLKRYQHIVTKCRTRTFNPFKWRSYPVFNVTSRIGYRNYYCARCNGEKIKDLTPVQLRFSCKSIIGNNRPTARQMYHEYKKGRCSLNYKIPKYSDRECHPNLIMNCPQKKTGSATFPKLNENDVKKCHKGKFNPIAIYSTKKQESWGNFSQIVYKNEYCRNCWKQLHAVPKAEVYSHNTVHRIRGQSDGVGRSNIPSSPAFEETTFPYIFNMQDWLDGIPDESPAGRVDQRSTRNFTASNTTTLNTTSGRQILGQAYTIVNFICSLLSIIALLILIVVYSLLKSLRNFNGWLALLLSITLFVARLIMLIDVVCDFAPANCTVLAAFKHYFLLASFIWMSVFSLETLRTFGMLGKYSLLTTQKPVNIWRHATATYAITFLFVFGGAMVQVGDAASRVSPSYGTLYGNCWFTPREYGIFLWWFTPVVSCLLFNCVVCSIVIYKLCKTQHNVKKNRSQENKKQIFWVCLKLTSIFGICWMLEFLVQFTNEPILIIIVHCINSLQGVFLALTFLITPRVKKSYEKSTSRMSSRFGSTRKSTHSSQNTKVSMIKSNHLSVDYSTSSAAVKYKVNSDCEGADREDVQKNDLLLKNDEVKNDADDSDANRMNSEVLLKDEAILNSNETHEISDANRTHDNDKQ